MNAYIIKGKKLITVSKKGSIEDGAMVIRNGKIREVGTWESIYRHASTLPIIDCSDHIITPSFVDCHTHLLEFAPTALYPITKHTQFLAGHSILLHALESGITALGEQVCGHPESEFSIADYRKAVEGIPMNISFAATSISIGIEPLAHFTSITKAKQVEKKDLLSKTILTKLATENDYPGENLFLNATPANFSIDQVPRAGEMIYSLEELKEIVELFHSHQKEIGVHVAGEAGIKMALEAKVDVLHHAHGINEELMRLASANGTKVVATPLGGTHLQPNSPEEIVALIEHNIPVAIATDAYLPPYPNVSWIPYNDQQLRGPEVLMEIAHPAMKLLKQRGYDENKVIALITANPASILGKGKQFGSLIKGMDANFLVTTGIPGLEVTTSEQIKAVYYQGEKVISR